MTNAPLSRFDPDHLHHKMVQLGEIWADYDAAASLLEESKKSVLAELTLGASGGVAERERAALASDAYQAHVSEMVEARRKANRAKVNYHAAQTWCDLARSMETTRRVEMGMR